jgi:hypothetical protein
MTTATNEPEPSRCSKCGSLDIKKKYSALFNKLLVQCVVCSFSWAEEPLDKQEPKSRDFWQLLRPFGGKDKK